MKIRTDDDNVELEPALQELVLNLLGDGVETDIRLCTDFVSYGGHYSSSVCVGRQRENQISNDSQRRGNLTLTKRSQIMACGCEKFKFAAKLP